MSTPKNGNGSSDLNNLINQNKERLKELATINQTTSIIKAGKPLNQTLQEIAEVLPDGWQYPEHTVARITYGDKEFTSINFEESQWYQSESFKTIENKTASLEVYYSKEFVQLDEGPFLHEERELILNIGNLVQGYLNSIEASAKSQKAPAVFGGRPETFTGKKPSNRQLLHKFLNANNYSRDLYHDLMQFKVKEVLLVGTLYDAYSLESEGRFAEHVLGEYRQLNLTFTPRITGVSTEEEVFHQLDNVHYDLIIFVIGIDKKMPLMVSQKVKARYPYIPLFFLVNNNSDISHFSKNKPRYVDRIFSWNGDSNIFLAMIKLVEDRVNVNNDTRLGMVRVILLVEDSPKYYSRLVPLLYRVVLEQTRRIIDDVEGDELYQLLRLRARPKILIASTHEEALSIIRRYKEYLQCLITDVRFPKDGVLAERAGYDLVKTVHNEIGELPICIQSSDVASQFKKNTCYINKNSETLENDIRVFIDHFVGFGNFTFRDQSGRNIAVAKNLKEFEKYIRIISDESLAYHAHRNHFSQWLMARGEIQLAKILNPYKLDDFNNIPELRDFLLDRITQFRNERIKGKIVPFREQILNDERNIAEIGTGALGGKGRGVAFINTLIYNFDFSRMIPDIHIRAPRTVIIGVDEFHDFIEENSLKEYQQMDIDYKRIKKAFLESKMSRSIVRQIRTLIKNIKKPLAIRSSSLLEDSLYQPFAGIFSTYIIPNNHPDPEVRLEQCLGAIKMVYASLYSPNAKAYINAINYHLEEEKMAVVIQEVVGNQFGNSFYPHISGVAQSYNYYPVGYMEPEDGFSVLALGLGKYVVEGEKAYRFCPKYPKVDIVSMKDQFEDSQVEYFGVDMSQKELNILEGEEAGLVRLDLDDAEMRGSLKHCASVYEPENQRITPGIDKPGPRIVNFANILKHGYIPLAETIRNVVDIVQEALGTTVEIEFAIDLNKDEKGKASFYLLQIKPLLGSSYDYEIDPASIDEEDVLLKTNKAMGNGKIETVRDIIFVSPQRFDKSKTEEMANEIAEINRKMTDEGREYVLMGPGRWGTRDKFIGIPVEWPQISSARVIVEYSFPEFPLDPSSGSHFFHNVTSMNVGYFSVQHEIQKQYIHWDKIEQLGAATEYKYFKHIRMDKALCIKMDGKNRLAVIMKKSDT